MYEILMIIAYCARWILLIGFPTMFQISHNPFTNTGAYGLLLSVEKNDSQTLKQVEMQVNVTKCHQIQLHILHGPYTIDDN